MKLTEEQKKEIYQAKFNLRGRRGRRNRKMWNKAFTAAKDTLAKYSVEYVPKWMQEGKS